MFQDVGREDYVKRMIREWNRYPIIEAYRKVLRTLLQQGYVNTIHRMPPCAQNFRLKACSAADLQYPGAARQRGPNLQQFLVSNLAKVLIPSVNGLWVAKPELLGDAVISHNFTQ